MRGRERNRDQMRERMHEISNMWMEWELMNGQNACWTKNREGKGERQADSRTENAPLTRDIPESRVCEYMGISSGHQWYCSEETISEVHVFILFITKTWFLQYMAALSPLSRYHETFCWIPLTGNPHTSGSCKLTPLICSNPWSTYILEGHSEHNSLT